MRGFRVKDRRLRLACGIVVTVVWSRDLPSAPSSVRIYRDSAGDWYASFVVAAVIEPLPATGAVIGTDWGVRQTATTTSGAHDFAHAGHGKRAQERMTRYDRMMARRKPGRGKPSSKGYREAKRLRAKAHRKAKTTLIEMARKYGRDIRLVHPAHTSTDCAQCGARAKHALPLSERSYSCAACGVLSDRDKNSARVMLLRAGLDPDGTDRIRPGGPQGQQAA